MAPTTGGVSPQSKTSSTWCDHSATRGLLVYVHFPHCLEKCPYCDFVSYKTARDEIDHEGYADAIVRELEARLSLSQPLLDRRLVSVFFGGGTPSLWRPSALGRALAAIRSRLVGDDVEVTVECNPTSLDEATARSLLDVGVNRLSIGVQSFSRERLAYLGRLHDDLGAAKALEAAARAGVPRFSGDLIYGVPGQSADEAAREALAIADRGATHVSAYSLTIEPGTRFGELARKGRLKLVDDGDIVQSFVAIHEALGARGFSHYEVSNHGVPGAESRHNLGYWRGLPYLGLGCGAVGCVPTPEGVVRYRNQIVPGRYVAATTGPLASLVESTETLSSETQLRERIMLGLRLSRGFDLASAAAEVGADPWPRDRVRAVERMVQRGRLLREGDVLRVPFEAWAFADGTAAELF